jgi:hypothetical protein
MTEPHRLQLVAAKVKGVHWFSWLESENGFVRARDLFRGLGSDETASRDRDSQSPPADYLALLKSSVEVIDGD